MGKQRIRAAKKGIRMTKIDIFSGFLGAGKTTLIKKLIAENGVTEIVVGLPKNMNGTEGPRAEVCKAFAELLKTETGLPVTMWDERRTTVEAHNILSAHNYHGQKRKNTVDAVAASLILEGYLAFRGR